MYLYCVILLAILYTFVLVVDIEGTNLKTEKSLPPNWESLLRTSSRDLRSVRESKKTFEALKWRRNVQRKFNTKKLSVRDRNVLPVVAKHHESITSQSKLMEVTKGSGRVEDENSKRQYIYGVPQMFPLSELAPRRDFVAYPRGGIHRGACMHHICYHGGICVRTMHGYYCDCPEEFIGTHCEFKRVCLQNPCKNAGTCTELGQREFTCTCALGSKGKTCEAKDSCVPNPCDSEGHCTEMEEGYHCTCKLGFKGDRCQTKALCYPHPCKNGGTCMNREDREYKCSCALGYKGDLCEILSECKVDPCMNGGTCVELAVGYKCACLKGFVGKNCEESLCHPNPCANDGTCKLSSDHYTCSCPQHYVGKYCEVLNPCLNNPCLNGGDCVATRSSIANTNDGFSCKCLRGYYGNMCQMK